MSKRSTSPARIWLTGFVLLGFLLGLLGPLLIVWQYHLEGDPRIAGLHFLGLNAGYVLAVVVSQRLLKKVSPRTVAFISSGIAFLGLLGLGLVAPPIAAVWRVGDICLLGIAAGALATALLHALESEFRKSPLGTLNRSGLMLGAGCFLATVTVGALYATGHTRADIAILAAGPLGFFLIFARKHVPLDTLRVDTRREQPRYTRSIATVLFSLLLFFQFGNEWAIAGWLPFFLIRRLGSNPAAAIFALALYFLFLMLARWLAQVLVTLVSHRRLLLASIVVAMSGYFMLATTSTLSAAFTSIVLIGLGFGPIYPLTAENLDTRFSYQPGFYNGMFSVAITGAMAAPWLLGYVCEDFGVQYLFLLPAIGSAIVLLLCLLIMLEARVMGHSADFPKNDLLY